MKYIVRAIPLALVILSLFGASPTQAWWFTHKKKQPLPSEEMTPASRAELTRAQERMDSGKYRAAVKILQRAIKRFPAQEAFKAEALYLLGSCQLVRKQYMKSFETFQSIIDAYPLSDRVDEIIEQEYVIAEMFYARKQYTQSQLIFSKVLLNAPFKKVADTAQFKEAMSLFHLREFIRARDSFEKIPENYSFSSYADDAQFYAGLCSYKISSLVRDYDAERLQRAIDDLKYFIQRNPTSEFVPQAQDLLEKLYAKEAEKIYLIGAYYQKIRELQTAKKYFTEVSREYEKTIWANRANRRLEQLDRRLR